MQVWKGKTACAGVCGRVRLNGGANARSDEIVVAADSQLETCI